MGICQSLAKSKKPPTNNPPASSPSSSSINAPSSSTDLTTSKTISSQNGTAGNETGTFYPKADNRGIRKNSPKNNNNDAAQIEAKSRTNSKLLTLTYNPSWDDPYFAIVNNPRCLDWRRRRLHSDTKNRSIDLLPHSDDHFCLTQEQIAQQFSKQTSHPVQITPYLYLSCASAINSDTIQKKLVKQLHITHILNVGGKNARARGAGDNGDPPEKLYKNAGILSYKELLEAKDEFGYGMLRNHFWECHEFISTALDWFPQLKKVISEDEHQNQEESKDAKEEKETVKTTAASIRKTKLPNNKSKIVVHCMAGINRSAAIVAAELMVREDYTLFQTIRHLRHCRGNCTLQNETFQRELVMFARSQGLLDDRNVLQFYHDELENKST